MKRNLRGNCCSDENSFFISFHITNDKFVIQHSSWPPEFWNEDPTVVPNMISDFMYQKNEVKKDNCSRYRPGMAQSVGRGIALLFHDRGTRRGWVVSSTPLPHFTPGKDPVPILQEAGWSPRPVWTGGKSHPHRYSIPDRPARSQSLYWLSYPTHTRINSLSLNIIIFILLAASVGKLQDFQ